MDSRLSLHHIGARAGSQVFPVSGCFAKDMVSVLYDADAECLSQVSKSNKETDAEVYIMPFCIGDQCKQTIFNLKYALFGSTLKTTNPAYKNFYTFHCMDKIRSEIMETMEQRSVELVTLDSLYYENSAETIPPPDFLSIDAEGAAYDILSGATHVLQNTLAIEVEAEFHCLHKDQKLFGDIAGLLNGHGFYFVKFTSLHGPFSPFRAPVGLRGDGFTVVSDSLFLKNKDTLIDPVKPIDSIVALYKLAFISISYNQFEYALSCLNTIKTLNCKDLPESLTTTNYYRFLKHLEEQAEKMPLSYPHTYRDIYPSFAASKARFEVKTERSKGETDSLSAQASVAKSGNAVKSSLLRLRKPILNIILSPMFLKVRFFLCKLFGMYSPVEKVLLNYGLMEQSDLIMKKRIEQSFFIATDVNRLETVLSKLGFPKKLTSKIKNYFSPY
ncbi:FkbM family methyltransferase [Candidatus Magnetomonas plexicatena]|uniref:FkbM family methyltransferase n=1 Tax=Candidatus Magnetomonas plexicatena TaxID=2552947 RepID=UPI0011041F6E|nr:FkbM family methyltransferase [Nitrospirales bacterium LBB_01]